MCGIIGFSGFKNTETGENNTYSADKIKLLLYMNSVERDSKDSIGFYIKGHNNPIKSSYAAKWFLAYSKNDDLINKTSDLFIGHVRKKSSSTIDVKNAHPYRVGNIIGVHNGTISNISEVCKKFEVEEVKDRTDSLNLYRCIASYGNATPIKYAVGPCTLLFTDISNPSVMYLYAREREIYYGTIENEGIYISSDRYSLSSIGCSDIQQFKDNEFVTIQDGIITPNFMLEVKKLSPASNTNTIPALRWARAITSDPESGIIKGNFYYISKVHFLRYDYTTASNIQEFEITNGEGLLFPENLNYVRVSPKLFDNSPNYNYFQITKTNKVIMVNMRKLYFPTKEATAEVGELFVVDDYTLNKGFSGYWVNGGFSVINVAVEDLRLATLEEESILFQLLHNNAIDGSSEYDFLKDVKFSPDVEYSTNVSSLMEVIYNNVKSLETEIDSLKGINKQKRKQLEAKLNFIYDELEQFNTNVTT